MPTLSERKPRGDPILRPLRPRAPGVGRDRRFADGDLPDSQQGPREGHNVRPPFRDHRGDRQGRNGHRLQGLRQQDPGGRRSQAPKAGDRLGPRGHRALPERDQAGPAGLHRHVCRMYDLGEEWLSIYISMEYVAGEDLKRFIHRAGHLNEAKASTWPSRSSRASSKPIASGSSTATSSRRTS